MHIVSGRIYLCTLIMKYFRYYCCKNSWFISIFITVELSMLLWESLHIIARKSLLYFTRVMYFVISGVFFKHTWKFEKSSKWNAKYHWKLWKEKYIKIISRQQPCSMMIWFVLLVPMKSEKCNSSFFARETLKNKNCDAQKYFLRRVLQNAKKFSFFLSFHDTPANIL